MVAPRSRPSSATLFAKIRTWEANSRQNGSKLGIIEIPPQCSAFTEDELEGYLLGHSPQDLAGRIEDHCRVCLDCQARLAELEEFTAKLKVAPDRVESEGIIAGRPRACFVQFLSETVRHSAGTKHLSDWGPKADRYASPQM